MKIHGLFIKTHRVLGICLSILFLMWFVSGIVMMYHTYPRVEKEQALAFAEDIDTVLLPIQNLVEELPLRDPVKSISLNKRAGENVIRIPFECPDRASHRQVFLRAIAANCESMVFRGCDAERYTQRDRRLADRCISVQRFPGLSLLFPG